MNYLTDPVIPSANCFWSIKKGFYGREARLKPVFISCFFPKTDMKIDLPAGKTAFV